MKDFARIIAILMITLLCRQTFPQSFVVDTLLYNGDKNKLINIVLMGDGYLTEEEDDYVADALTITEYFFSQDVFGMTRIISMCLPLRFLRTNPEPIIREPLPIRIVRLRYPFRLPTIILAAPSTLLVFTGLFVLRIMTWLQMHWQPTFRSMILF